jgi:mannose-6-phosphate isomerase
VTPFLLSPSGKDYIWGGERLKSDYGKALELSPLAETWECSVHPDGPSFVASGAFAGRTLAEVLAENPAWLGTSFSALGGLHILVKLIDAKRDLSVQVHPDDDFAFREEGGQQGKTEMWYVLDAEPGAYLYSGFKEELSSEEYKRKVADGTIVESLAKHEVKAGDVFYLPAGRVHAICSGILLAEVQQSSDVTYRIYDYNRPGLDGKPRELHTELAAEALNYQVEKEYRTEYSSESNRANSVVESPYFSVRVTEFSDTFHRNLIKYDSFIISMCLKGDCKIKVRSTGDEITLREGYSCLIPAAIADYAITPVKGSSKVLDAYINNMDKSLLNKVSRFLHISMR